MHGIGSRISRYAWPALVLVLPLMLLGSALMTFGELREMKRVYLRDQAAAIAARLERLPAADAAALFETIAAEEPALVDLRVFESNRNGPESAALDSIWRGDQLFKLEERSAGQERIFRAYIPFHSESELRIARIDLAASSADFLVAHARHNVMIASVSGLALVLLSVYAVWSARRRARLERGQLELEHLAHLGKMSAVLAHEIRNPLGTIKGFAQLATERADRQTKGLLDPILDEAQRLENLVTDLLLYGRPPTPALRYVEWPAMARELRTHMEGAIGDRPVRFAVDETGWRIRTDPDLLKQILLNLLRNSSEALGDAGGEIRLAASRAGRELVITVEDNGPGLSEAARKRLFEPFFTTKTFGSGLGLSIARKLTRALGGELHLEPLEPHGTRAEVRLEGVEFAQI